MKHIPTNRISKLSSRNKLKDHLNITLDKKSIFTTASHITKIKDHVLDKSSIFGKQYKSVIENIHDQTYPKMNIELKKIKDPKSNDKIPKNSMSKSFEALASQPDLFKTYNLIPGSTLKTLKELVKLKEHMDEDKVPNNTIQYNKKIEHKSQGRS